MKTERPGSITDPAARPGARMLNKVPQITIYFWIIKVLCTTVGETAADSLNETLKLGLTLTTLVMGGLLAVTLVLEFRARRYVPGLYWLAVVLLSVVGTLITDNLTDNLGVPLLATTLVFALALALTFAAWYRSERTLSIRSIVTTRREAFYWAAILFTFALGTAAGDLVSEQFGIGYLPSLLLFGAMIAAVALAYRLLRGDGVLAFWAAYILTRPLGAAAGDWLSQESGSGGLGLGPLATSGLFLTTILALVIYLTVTRRDALDTVAPAG